MLLLLYAAFSHGAVQSPAEARIQVVLAVIASIAAGAWLWSGALRFAAPRAARLGLGLLAAFALWSGVSLIWSVAPNATWIETNRVVTYVIVLVLAIIAGASAEESLQQILTGLLVLGLVVTAYALGQKVAPGLHIAGVFDLNQTGPLPRLQEPFGYWNALALFIALPIPAALWIATDGERPRRVRLAALIAMELMLLTIGFTYSRGGALALAVGLGVAVTAGGVRLRSLMWLGVVVLASVPSLVVGLTVHALTSNGIRLERRELAGALLLGVIALCTLTLAVVAWRLFQREERTRLSPARVQRIGRTLGILVAGVIVVLLLGVIVSPRGFTGTVSHTWQNFTATRAVSVSDPSRLLSADSGNRWVWWKEAIGAFSDRPVRGWGAGSFGVVHLLYRRDTLSVQQPHNVPLQWLAEDGLIGTLLAVGAFVMMLSAAVHAVRRLPRGRERALAAAALAGVVAYAVHSFYDWDWDIPGITLPTLMLLGVLLGWSARARRDVPSRPRVIPRENVDPVLGAGGRLLAIAAVTAAMCCLAVSAALPSLASDDARAALVDASSPSRAALASAQRSALLAGRLDPLSDGGLRAEAAIALHRDDPAGARGDLLAAVARDPTDPQAWASLAYVDVQLGRLAEGRTAAQRVLALDPRGQATAAFAGSISQRATILQASPTDSATAISTPPGS
ncbi:MAG: O-antigen ligase family protein [Solirubrobacteraceae bacterium]